MTILYLELLKCEKLHLRKIGFGVFKNMSKVRETIGFYLN